MTALTHKENDLHNRLIVAEFNLGQAEKELRRLREENEALRARLAQPEPEPVAWTPKIERLYDKNGFLLHQKIKRTPSSEWEDYYPEPQREWQSLTDEEIKQLWKDTPQLVGVYSYTDIAREVEAKLKEKNT